MQKWEYLEMYVDDDHWEDNEGRKGKLSSGNYATARLNELGAEGWELAGVASPHPGAYTVFFKRPRAQRGRIAPSPSGRGAG